MMKKNYASAILLSIAVFALGASEKYESAGFSARILGNGTISGLSYAGKLLAKDIFISGHYNMPKGMEKHDNRFFQTWDYSNPAKFKRDGEKLTVTVNSKLSTKKFKDAVNYRYVCTFEPKKIVIECAVTQNVDLLSDYYMFSLGFHMDGSLFGRGVKVLTRNGQEEFKVLPETYNQKFKLDGKNLQISTEKGVLSVIPDPKESFFTFSDLRRWKQNKFTLGVIPPCKWTWKPVNHKAGTVWKWGCTLQFTPEK